MLIESRVTVNHDCPETRGSGQPTSPEFQFMPHPLTDHTHHDYQFGSPASSVDVSNTSPLSTANSSSISLNSSTSGRSSAKLNVFAKEFIPNLMPQNISIITKNEMGGVMSGPYAIPPLIPPPFIVPPYAHPIMFLDPSRYPHAAIPMGHASSLRPNPTGPQVAVVAPYRAAHEPRSLLVVNEKYCTEEIEIEEGEEEEEDGISVTIDINQVKSLSLSPPPRPPQHTTLNNNQRSSSTSDLSSVAIDHAHEDTPTHVQTTPTHTSEPLPNQSDIKSSKNNSPSLSLPPSPPLSTHSTPSSPSCKLSSQTTPTKAMDSCSNSNSKDEINNNNNSENIISINETPPDSATEIVTKEEGIKNDVKISSPSPLSPTPLTTSHDQSHDTLKDTLTSQTVDKINSKLKNDNNLIKDTNNSLGKTTPTTTPTDNNNSKISNELIVIKKQSSPPLTARSWAAIVGKTALATPTTIPPTRTQTDTSTKASMKSVGVADGGAKEDRAKVEELKQERLQFLGSN